MRDETIRSNLKEQMDSVHLPEGLRSRTLRTLSEAFPARKKRILTPVLCAILCCLFVCTALAAGGFLWEHPLDAALRPGESSAAVSYPDLSVTQQGVTIRLDQCVADEHTAYIAFVLSGFSLPEGRHPAFRLADVQTTLKPGHGKAGYFLTCSPDGVTDWYTDDQGNLVYLFLISSPDDDLPGRSIRVEFSDLGFDDPAQTEAFELVVPGTWTFDWTLSGVSDAVSYAALSLPIGDSGWTLTSASLTPVTAIVTMSGPQALLDSDFLDALHTQPVFVGVEFLDGETQLMAGMLSSTLGGTELRQFVTLNHVINVPVLRSLLFAVPGMDAPVCVPLPSPASSHVPD